MDLSPPPVTGNEEFDEWMERLYRFLSYMPKLECQFIELQELSAAPDAPGTNRVRIYAIDATAKTRLSARFATGAAQTIATEP